MLVLLVVVRNVVSAANAIVVGVLYLNVCLVVGVVVVVALVDLWWWWQGWLDITVDGGIMVIVLMVMVMVMGFLKRTPKAQNILVFIWLV